MGVLGDNDLANMNMTQLNTSQINQSVNYNNVNNFQEFNQTQRTINNNANNNILGTSMMHMPS
jgi:hypothetical protein